MDRPKPILLILAVLGLMAGPLISLPTVTAVEASTQEASKQDDPSKEKAKVQKETSKDSKDKTESDLGKAILDNDQIKVTLLRTEHDYVTEDSQNFRFYLKVENKTDKPLMISSTDIQLNGKDQAGITGLFTAEVDPGDSQEEYLNVSNALSGKDMPDMEGIMTFELKVFPQNNSLALKKYTVDINLDGLNFIKHEA